MRVAKTLGSLLGAVIMLPSSTIAASLQQITNFGTNPTNVAFYLYVPDKLKAKAPLLVYPHWCHGSAKDAFNSKPWKSYADSMGFIVIYPSTPWTSDSCWDVSSPQTLKHNGGGDSQGIVSMVKWTISHYDVDPDRVFVSGTSSGAMMTNVLIGAYPDMFAAGAALAGVPFSCFSGTGYDQWSSACAAGSIQKTGDAWASIVRAAYPEYTGPRPKMQVFHGSADQTLNIQNFYEEVKQWTTVLGAGNSTQVSQNTPQAGWTKTTYGSKGYVEAFLASGVSHDIPDQPGEVIRFFDLGCSGTNCFSRKSLV
jgi:acetylxylan esterase